MARPPKGKALTLRPIRLDDDVWAECQRLGKAHGTINEGLRTVLIVLKDVVTPVHRVRLNTPPPTQTMLDDTEAFRSAINDEVRKHNHRVFKGPILKPKDRK